LPSRFARELAASTAASSVCKPRINSTSAIMGTGLKKCIPMKRSGRFVVAASLVIEIDEVLVAMIASAFASSSICFRIFTFSASFSVAASMTRSHLRSTS
jgi:hypothetical protein